MTGGTGSSFHLANILQQRRWQFCTEPFPHFVCRDVFTPAFYWALDGAYGEALSRGFSEEEDATRFSRSIKNYDAYSMTFREDMPEPFRLFISREWHDMLANLVGLPATRDVNGGFHYHVQGSKSGQVHNDLNPGWFVNASDPLGVNLARSDLCDYSTGCAFGAGFQVHETVRALACLLFLHNPAWYEGDGGETGLYSHSTQPVSSPTKAIPPINNSMLLFECRPDSYHSFISNRNGPRNSMIMWLHRPKIDVERRWGRNFDRQLA